jgi:hypothetical protein
VNCGKRCFLLVRPGAVSRGPTGQASQSRVSRVSREIESLQNLESAISSWKTDPREIFADGRRLWKRGGWRSIHCCKTLRSNAELGVSQSLASKDVKTEAAESTGWQAVTRQ